MTIAKAVTSLRASASPEGCCGEHTVNLEVVSSTHLPELEELFDPLGEDFWINLYVCHNDARFSKRGKGSSKGKEEVGDGQRSKCKRRHESTTRDACNEGRFGLCGIIFGWVANFNPVAVEVVS